MLCTLMFQSSAGSDESDEIRNTVDIVVQNSNLWTCYKIARSAARLFIEPYRIPNYILIHFTCNPLLTVVDMVSLVSVIELQATFEIVLAPNTCTFGWLDYKKWA